MSLFTNYPRLIFIFGAIALIAGVIDPMEGSLAIAGGSALVTLSAYMTHDKHRENFLFSFLLIIFGVFFLFFFSSLGGFGNGAVLSWWWAMLILPYPLGWLLAIVLLIAHISKRRVKQRT